MKAIFALAFAALVSAAPAPISTQYLAYDAQTLSCAPVDGYLFTTLSPGTTIPTPPGTSNVPFTDATGPVNTSCFVGDGIGLLLSCATGYTPTGLNGSNVATFGYVANGTWSTNAANVTIPSTVQGLYDYTTTTFSCVATVYQCAYNCTGSCKNTSGNVAANASFTSICSSGYVGVSSPTTCPSTGLSNTTAVVCTNDPALVPANEWFALASQYSYSIPNFCGCTSDPVCPSTIKCSKCYLPCTQRRQATVAAAVFCPTATTVDQMVVCFREGACAGAIQPGDTCIYGPVGSGTAPCPLCPKGSKKGLLGLLGLLGLIPLLLCSLLCCLLLLCIRRKKMERDVHFATFDAGAPPLVAAPHCHEVPVATHHSVHHATYVGAPHIDQHAHLAY